jgi:hypothetical protein
MRQKSDYLKQNASISSFKSNDSWVILTDIEKRIKDKIEAVGTPLKDWDINIYRGVLTGFNEAFIISGAKKEEILANCKSEDERTRTDELIRPILRGRDIKRFDYDFADLWLINTHNGVKEKGVKPINIDDYPALKEHLNKYYNQLEKRQDKGDTPYNLRNCAYMEDFSKQKIVYIEIMTDNPTKGYDFPCFAFDSMQCITLNTAYIMCGSEIDLKYILAILNSDLGKRLVKYYVIQLQNRQFRMLHQYVSNFPIPKIKDSEKLVFKQLVDKVIQAKKMEEDSTFTENKINNLVNNLFSLTINEKLYIEKSN